MEQLTPGQRAAKTRARNKKKAAKAELKGQAIVVVKKIGKGTGKAFAKKASSSEPIIAERPKVEVFVIPAGKTYVHVVRKEDNAIEVRFR